METTEIKKNIKEECPQKFLKYIVKAISLSSKYHKGQNRFSGEPYVNHSLRTARTLARMGMDTNTVIAGVLHNYSKSTIYNPEDMVKEIVHEFGEEVVELIQKCNDISIATSSPDTPFEIVTKFVLNNAKDLRPVLIKLAETLDNVRTIEHMPQERVATKVHKILNIYAPLAEYLNLDNYKKELEERALKIYKPEEYKIIKNKMEENHITKDMLSKYIEYLEKILKDISPKPKIYGRVKGIYSIYNKQKKQLKEEGTVDISSIRDLLAFRVLTDSTDNCFTALEKVMDYGDILTKEFDDYISYPKPNGYKAFQGPIVLSEISNNIVEIQILTHDMLYHNTYGPASHIAYKESKSRYTNATDKYHWVEEVHKAISTHISLREKNISNPILVNIFPSKVYAFTPKRKIIQLEKGDTIVDFAFRVHTDIGNSMVAAKVNGKAQKLNYIIQTADTIEIKTQLGKKSVKQEWIQYANSTSTKNKIVRAWKNS